MSITSTDQRRDSDAFASSGAGSEPVDGPPRGGGSGAPPGAPEPGPEGRPDGGGGDAPETTRLRSLEDKIERLVGLCERLARENRALRTQQSNLLAERAQLIERSEIARSRVEAMIARLKAMESG